MWKPEYNDRKRAKYRADPEYRERVRASGRSSEENKEYMRAYYEANKHKWNRRTPEQRSRYNAKRRAEYAADPERRARAVEYNRQYATDGRKRDKRITREFGISEACYAAILALQGGVCAICGRRGADKRGHRLHIDHCHVTGTVRGLLCAGCNIGLGKFGDNYNTLERALEYLMDAGRSVDHLVRPQR